MGATPQAGGRRLGAYARVVAWALALSLALSTLVSGLLVGGLHDHTCLDDDCAYCHVVQRAETMLLSAGATLATDAAVPLAMALVIWALAVWSRIAVAETPVRWKVRLDI